MKIGILFLGVILSAPSFAATTFCGFFVDRKPLTVEFTPAGRAVLSYDGQVYDVTVTSREELGYEHGYYCDDSVFCLTGIEATLAGDKVSLSISDQLSSASVSGKILGHTVDGVGSCK